MNGENQNKIPEDEIDVRSLWKRISSFLSYPLRLFLSNKAVTLGFILAAFGVALGFKLLVPKTYSSSCVIRPLDGSERIHLRILKDVEVLLKYKDYRTLSTELKLDSLTAATLVKIESINPSLKNPVDSANITEIIITTSNPEMFKLLQNALLNYLENNPYFFKIKELQKKQIALELEQVEKDLVKLDSLKTLQLQNYKQSASSQPNTLVLNELINPVAAYKTANERMEKKSGLLARTVFTDNFQLVKSVVAIKRHTWPPRFLMLCLYILPLFLFICFLFLHGKRLKQ